MNILIIDDDENIRNALQEVLTKENHKVFTVEDGNQGLDFFKKEHIDLCFLDLWMPNIGGIEVLKIIKEQYPNVEIIMISGDAKIDHAVKATKIGAYDFIEKPLVAKNIIDIVRNIEKSKKNKNTSNILEIFKPDELIGQSKSFKALMELIENAAKSDARILITGENGTGKELVARAIHFRSNRASMPFVGVNCAAIPETLIESELFGYTKGSFTGASSDRMGKFELANGGTLFLDEVADMSLSTQAKVLRVLQEMKIARIGDVESKNLNIRIISATNKDIKEEIKNGNFREDLYYRLNVIPVYMPSLRERKDDIPILIKYFMENICKSNKIKNKELENEAINYMMEYTWPGNIRQLRNIIERLIVMVQSDLITLNDVKTYLDDETLITNNSSINKYEKLKLDAAREEFEKDFIEKKLKENNYNLTKTAKALGLYPGNLHSKMAKLNIDVKKMKRK
jgi:two-component system nitrogen regulation response regulator NtrX